MRLISLFVMILLLSACAAGFSNTGARSEEEKLLERVEIYLKAKQMKDWDAVKDLVDPDLRENITPYLDSLKAKPSKSELTSYSIKEFELNGDEATVLSSITWKIAYTPLSNPSVEVNVRDKWVKKGGIWYVVIKRPSLSEAFKNLGQK